MVKKKATQKTSAKKKTAPSKKKRAVPKKSAKKKVATKKTGSKKAAPSRKKKAASKKAVSLKAEEARVNTGYHLGVVTRDFQSSSRSRRADRQARRKVRSMDLLNSQWAGVVVAACLLLGVGRPMEPKVTLSKSLPYAPSCSCGSATT